MSGTTGNQPKGVPAQTSPAAGQDGAQGGDSKSASGSATKESATGARAALMPLDPSPAPPRTFARPRIGLALGGGGALALTEVGVLKWFEENHIPIDVVAGTSMGCMVSALYSTGLTPDELAHVMNDRVFASVFTFSNAYTSRSFRRREDTRDLPNGVTIGLKHGVSFRNAVLTDQGLNAFLDRHFLRYDDRTDFNTLPIPLRCVSTDLNDARAVTFARGSIPDAVRASVSLPGVFQPFELNGHEYIDGGVLENLPTPVVKTMDADVVLAVSLPLAPVAKGELNSLLGVLTRSFAVAIEGAEREQRKQAQVVVMPDITGYSATDYLKTVELAQRGYQAAEVNRAALLPYAVSNADWNAYLAHRASLRRGAAGPVLRVRVTAPNESAELAVQRLFAPLVNQPVDTAKIEALLDQVRSDGRYQADYTIGYESAQQFAAQAAGVAPVGKGTIAAPVATRTDQLPPDQRDAAKAQTVTQPNGPENKVPGSANAKPGTAPSSNQPGVTKSDGTQTELADRPDAHGLNRTQTVNAQSLADIAARPIILVTVADKKTGPPFVVVGANVEAQAGGFARATLEAIVLDQDLGGYGAELRSHIKVGYLTELSTEYFRPIGLFSATNRTFFVAPRGGLVREPFPIYRDQNRVAIRQLQTLSTGGDFGLTNQRTQELRAGFDFEHISWNPTIGNDLAPSYTGTADRARVLYNFDTQDRALVPLFGLHVRAEAAYLFSAVGSQNAPELAGQVTYAHRFGSGLHPDGKPSLRNGDNVLILDAQFGTEFNRNVAQPFRYTVGGPLQLSASAIDQYRGTDYFLLEPAILRRIAQLPQPLGQSFYLGLGLEAARVFNPDAPTITREDAYFGFVAETPLGAITLAPAIGSNGERKLVFTLGKIF